MSTLNDPFDEKMKNIKNSTLKNIIKFAHHLKDENLNYLISLDDKGEEEIQKELKEHFFPNFKKKIVSFEKNLIEAENLFQEARDKLHNAEINFEIAETILTYFKEL